MFNSTVNQLDFGLLSIRDFIGNSNQVKINNL